MSPSTCAILFSGGTDSFCAAALCAEDYREIYLLTFFEKATENSPLPKGNVEKLRTKFPNTTFFHFSISVEKLVQKISYHNYFRSLGTHGFCMLATPGFSALSWHLAAIRFCKSRNIHNCFDGMTRELMHLPGHMTCVRSLFQELYASHGIQFSSPVIDWPAPPDQQMTDRLIVDRHGFSLLPKSPKNAPTTGEWLYKNGLLPERNVKGSLFDRRMQHDCYPFIVYNILAFWFYPCLISWPRFEKKLEDLMKDRIVLGQKILQDALETKTSEPTFFEPEVLL